MQQFRDSGPVGVFGFRMNSSKQWKLDHIPNTIQQIWHCFLDISRSQNTQDKLLRMSQSQTC